MIAPRIALETPVDAAEVDALIDCAFGPGRLAKTAERLREHQEPRYDLSLVARDGGRLVGCVRQWPIRVGEADALLLGPIAVDPAFRSHGLGGALIHRACRLAEEAGYRHVLLVGDEPLFGPHGFSAEAAREVVFPGPVDRRRLLARSTDGERLSGVAR